MSCIPNEFRQIIRFFFRPITLRTPGISIFVLLAKYFNEFDVCKFESLRNS